MKKYFETIKTKLNALQYRYMTCTRCGQRLRFPVQKGKVIRITCPNCRSMFDVDFVNPLKSIFKWERNLSWQENLKAMKREYKSFPSQTRFSLVLFALSLFLVLFLISLTLILPHSIPARSTSPTHSERISL